MTTLPAFKRWNTTRDSLHRAALVLGRIRSLLIRPEPYDAHFGLQVIAQGLGSGLLLPGGNEFVLDFGAGAIEYYSAANTEMFQLPLDGETPASLMVGLVSQMKTVRFASHALDLPDDDKPFKINKSQAADYAQVLNLVASGMTGFRQTLTGEMSPLLVWPDRFDLSFAWHPVDQADERYVRFGFVPSGHGSKQPHLYVTAYPRLPSIDKNALPDCAQWRDKDGFAGALIDYRNIRAADDPETLVQTTLNSLFQLLRDG